MRLPDGFMAQNSRKACWRFLHNEQTSRFIFFVQYPYQKSCRGSGRLNMTFSFQKVRSLWQSEVQMIRIRTSPAIGGATITSSITSGSPAFLLTAATQHKNKYTPSLHSFIIIKSFPNNKKDFKEYLCIEWASP